MAVNEDVETGVYELTIFSRFLAPVCIEKHANFGSSWASRDSRVSSVRHGMHRLAAVDIVSILHVLDDGANQLGLILRLHL